MERETLKDVILETLIESGEAQLRALRRLRAQRPESTRSRKRRSNLDLVEDILQFTGTPLHIQEILRRVEQVHRVRLDRESLVSQITKQVVRQRRFVRTAPNTFACLREAEPS